jgi:hypothetical protein
MKRSAAFVVVTGLAFAISLRAATTADSDASKVESLHAQLITPASDALFEAESKPPATPDEWARIVARAADLVRAAQGLESLQSAKGQTEWLQLAHSLSATAKQAARAAQAKDQDALVNANGEIVSVCEDCHTKYRDGGRSMKQ